MRHTFQAEQWLPFPVEEVFAFFANPQNLPRLMPTWQKARIDEASLLPPPPRPASVLPSVAAGAGSHVTISFRAFPLSPVRIPWEAEITEFTWNDHFCDFQLRGPFAYWKHCHSVRPETRDDRPGTLLRDEVQYEMRFGILGRLAHALGGRWQIEKMFDIRHQRTAAIFKVV